MRNWQVTYTKVQIVEWEAETEEDAGVDACMWFNKHPLEGVVETTCKVTEIPPDSPR